MLKSLNQAKDFWTQISAKELPREYSEYPAACCEKISVQRTKAPKSKPAQVGK